MQYSLFNTSDRNQFITDLFQAYYDARKNKRNKIGSLAFEWNFESRLIQLCDEILSGNYFILPNTCFIVNDPVKREIFAADFRDRIVHHLIYNYIAPVFEKTFIYDSYSCRENKGTHLGIKRIDHFIRSCSNNYHNDAYILKLDIKGYFMSIDRSILFRKILHHLTQYNGELTFDMPMVLNLIRQVIFHDVRKGCIIKGHSSDWEGLPPSKSLFHSAPGKGLPIGNLTSQLFANIYLNDFDHYVKKELKIKYYGRYVDDFILIHENKEYLKSLIPIISSYLKAKLSLELHPKKIYLQHIEKGVKFLGAIIKPHRIYVSGRAKNNFIQAVDKSVSAIQQKRDLQKNDVQQIIATMNSYLGMMRHWDTFNLRKKYCHQLLNSQKRFLLKVDTNYFKLTKT